MLASVKNTWAPYLRSGAGRTALVAVLLLTLIVGGLLTWAYWNPLGRTASVPAAIVDDDQPAPGAVGADPVGKEVTARILQSNSLGWQQTTLAQAQEGLASGKYLVVLHIPSEFSTTLASLDSSTPQQAKVELITSDATNYAVANVARNSLTEVIRGLKGGVTLNFLNQIYDVIPQVRDAGQTAAQGSQKLAETADAAAVAANQVATGAGTLAGLSQAAGQSAQEMATTAKSVATSTATASQGAQDAASSATAIAAGAKATDANLAAIQEQLTAKGQPDLAAALGAARTNLDNTVIKPTATLTTQTEQVATTTKQAATDAATLATQAQTASTKLTELTTTAQGLSAGAQQLSATLTTQIVPTAKDLSTSLAAAANKVPPVSAAQREVFTDVLAEPITVSQTRLNPVQSFGAGFAPYFIPGGLFLGVMVIFLLLRPLNVRAMSFGFPAWRIALPPWITGLTWMLGQSVLLLVGLAVLVGLNAAAWFPLIGIVLLAGICFMSMVHLLKAAFGVGGLYVALVGFVLMLTCSAGTFPIQMFASFFRLLSPLSPMTYATDGVRRTIAGGALSPYVWLDAAVLLAVTVVCVLATIGVAAYRRRNLERVAHPRIVLQ